MSLQQLKNIPDSFDDLEKVAINEGFEFLTRLNENWKDSSNRFDKRGEVLYGYFVNDKLIGICGRNIDPYSCMESVGRVRHLYIHPDFRKQGIAKKLIDKIFEDAKEFFWVLRLRTHNPSASQFYESVGFQAHTEENMTHFYKFNPTTNIADKVRLFIFREREEKELLVFSEPEYPEARYQVPGGTVDPGEELMETVIREMHEESGLEIKDGWEFVYAKETIHPMTLDAQNENVFMNNSDVIDKDRWSHLVFGEGVDSGIEFAYEWVSIKKAKEILWPWMARQLDYCLSKKA